VWRLTKSVLFCLAPAAFALLAGCGGIPGLGSSDAEIALEAIASGHGASRLKSRTPAPIRYTARIKSRNGGFYAADVYLSPEGARAGIVLVPGVVAEGKDDPRLVALALTLARLQFAVLVPDIQGIRNYRVRASDVHAVADAFRYLVSQPTLAPAGRAGVAGFSYGAGPVILAALQPEIREQVRFVLTVGGYYSLQTVVSFFTTGYHPTPAMSGPQVAPHPYIKWVFTLSNADLLERPSDRDALRAYASDVIHDQLPAPADPPVSLAPDAQALYDLLVNTNPSRVSQLIDNLSPRIRDELRGIDPASHDLSKIRARVILLHGRADNLIPYTESLAMATALPKGKASLFLIEGLVHVDIRPGEKDIPVLLEAVRALLAERGG